MIKLDKTAYRERGTGRPTKKERRDLDSFVDETPYFLDDEDDWDFDD
jgi:ribosome-associated heat shock protein Hsp15